MAKQSSIQKNLNRKKKIRDKFAKIYDSELSNLVNLQQKYDLSYIFISHDMKVIKSVSDYIIVMKNAKIIEEGTTDSIFNKPFTTYTKKLLQAVI